VSTLTKQDYFDLGFDSEQWLLEHMKATMPALKHDPTPGYDLKASVHGHTTLIDCKFLKQEYRKPGWIETSNSNKRSGIFESARNFKDDLTVDVRLALMHMGQYYLYDVKAIRSAIISGQLQLSIHQSVVDDCGRKTTCKYIMMNGWSDKRFQVGGGVCNPALWNPQTSIGQGLDINLWMTGKWENTKRSLTQKEWECLIKLQPPALQPGDLITLMEGETEKTAIVLEYGGDAILHWYSNDKRGPYYNIRPPENYTLQSSRTAKLTGSPFKGSRCTMMTALVDGRTEKMSIEECYWR